MSEFVYVYRYYNTDNNVITLTTNTMKSFPNPGAAFVQAGSEALVEQGQDTIWVTGDSQFDDNFEIKNNATNSNSVTIEPLSTFNGTVTLNGDVTIDSGAELTVDGPATFNNTATFTDAVTFDGTVTFNGQVDLSLPKISLYSTSTATIINAPPGTAIPYDVERVKDGDFFNHSTTVNNTDITIQEAGSYKIDANVTTYTTSNSRAASRFDIYINGTVLAGTSGWLYNRNIAQGANSATSTLSLTLAANDVITVQAYRYSGSGTLALGGVGAAGDGNSITIIKL